MTNKRMIRFWKSPVNVFYDCTFCDRSTDTYAEYDNTSLCVCPSCFRIRKMSIIDIIRRVLGETRY